MSTGDQCHLDWLNPSNPDAFAPQQQCKQGSVSPFYVSLRPLHMSIFASDALLQIDVTGKEDVLAAYEFSKKEGVQLTIKNTGVCCAFLCCSCYGTQV